MNTKATTGLKHQTYRIDVEWHDGSDHTWLDLNLHEAWQLIAWLELRGGYKSAWRNGEPWLGDCTREDLP